MDGNLLTSLDAALSMAVALELARRLGFTGADLYTRASDLLRADTGRQVKIEVFRRYHTLAWRDAATKVLRSSSYRPSALSMAVALELARQLGFTGADLYAHASELLRADRGLPPTAHLL